MKSKLTKPLILGILAVLTTSIHFLPGWTPPDPENDGENVDIPTGHLQAAGNLNAKRLILKSTQGAENQVSENMDSPVIVSGYSNNLVRGGSAAESGSGLIVGNSNLMSSMTPSVGTVPNGVIGNSNDVKALCSLVVGNMNSVASSATNVVTAARFAGVFGLSNTVRNGSYSTFVSGGYNNVSADYSLISGQGNTVEGASVGGRTLVSAAIGTMNHIMANNSWTIGSSNEITANLSTALGVGLIADSMGCTFVGEINSPVQGSLTTRRSEDPVFVVGNGTDANNRSNALVIKRNGDIIITKPQGDISMGDFD